MQITCIALLYSFYRIHIAEIIVFSLTISNRLYIEYIFTY